jgi:hypothetical protein
MKFYYADGSVFEGEWEDAPGWMVQVIEFDDGTPSPALRHQGGYYRLDRDGQPVGIDLTDLLQYVVDIGLIKVGYMMGTRGWKETFEAANKARGS